jgi:hypothetical protein
MGTWLAGTFSCCAVTSRLHGLIKKLAGLWRASLQSLHPADWANAAEYRIHHALSSAISEILQYHRASLTRNSPTHNTRFVAGLRRPRQEELAIGSTLMTS